MKPTIYEDTTPDGRPSFYLVDELSVMFATHKGKPKLHFAAAVKLGDLKAGHIEHAIDKKTGILSTLPWPCVAMKRKTAKTNTLESRNIPAKAAEALLKLARAYNNVSMTFADGSWKWQTPAEKGEAAGLIEPWDEWKFVAAWRYGAWERGTLTESACKPLTGAERHLDMQSLGYPGTARALRQMLKRMGLVRPKPAKESGPTWSL